MASHFLLSAKARTISTVEVASMSEDEAHKLFAELRWAANDGNPICPECGNMGKCYARPTRRQWRCKECNHVFSATSGTVFAHHKKPLRDYLVAILFSVNASKSVAALHLMRHLNCQYKTAWVMLQKIRCSILEHVDDTPLVGTVEIDGVCVYYSFYRANKRKDRKDGRKLYLRNKRVIISIRLRHQEPGMGAVRTIVFVLKSENSKDIMKIVTKYVAKGSTIHADDAHAYDDLHAFYNMMRVNHQEEYKSDSGACNNQCESFNARFRGLYSQTQKLTPPISDKLRRRDSIQRGHEKI